MGANVTKISYWIAFTDSLMVSTIKSSSWTRSNGINFEEAGMPTHSDMDKFASDLKCYNGCSTTITLQQGGPSGFPMGTPVSSSQSTVLERVVSFPFDRDGSSSLAPADVILKSTDNVSFYTHQLLIQLSSVALGRRLAEGSVDPLTDGLPIVHIPENFTTLDLLL
ncbi:hypothetical protein OF83DRAFT_1179756 [Amylostereum chailletii]|nr:hypothetical protein OF83DRAFT_1179756 [Amylostereum chailletii]